METTRTPNRPDADTATTVVDEPAPARHDQPRTTAPARSPRRNRRPLAAFATLLIAAGTTLTIYNQQHAATTPTIATPSANTVVERPAPALASRASLLQPTGAVVERPAPALAGLDSSPLQTSAGTERPAPAIARLRWAVLSERGVVERPAPTLSSHGSPSQPTADTPTVR
jgi:hypothetical protein